MQKKAPESEQSSQPPELLVSPKELVQRWRCSRTQVDRIAKREGLTRLMLGEGRNGMVRYVMREIEDFESRRRVR